MRAGHRLLLVGIGIFSIHPCAFAEHEEQYGADYSAYDDTPLRRPANPAANALRLLPNAPPETNLQTIRDIQDSLRKADPKTLQALKQALTDISQGREVSGQAGNVALDLLRKIPDSEVAGLLPPVETEVTESVATAAAAGQSPTSNKGSPERFKGFSGAESLKAPNAAVPPGAVVVQPGAILKVVGSEPTPSSAPRGEAVTLRQPSSLSVLSAFPYNSATAAEEDEMPAVGQIGDLKVPAKRAVKAPAPEIPAGGEALPTGEGGARQIPFGPLGGALGTLVLNSRRAPASVAPAVEASASAPTEKQRLAGVVTSFLGRFRNRARMEAGLGGTRGVFHKLAETGGLTDETAVVKAAESPIYRKFQEATLDAGFSPGESLSAYYTVLALAWVGTFGFVIYLMRETPWLRLAVNPLRRSRKK